MMCSTYERDNLPVGLPVCPVAVLALASVTTVAPTTLCAQVMSICDGIETMVKRWRQAHHAHYATAQGCAYQSTQDLYTHNHCRYCNSYFEGLKLVSGVLPDGLSCASALCHSCMKLCLYTDHPHVMSAVVVLIGGSLLENS